VSLQAPEECMAISGKYEESNLEISRFAARNKLLNFYKNTQPIFLPQDYGFL